MTLFNPLIRKTLTTLATAVALVAPVQATPITYSEEVSGDLPIALSTTLFLGVGLNTVSGTIGYGTTGDYDLDSFSFVVPTGGKLDRIDVTMSMVSGDSMGSNWLVYGRSSSDDSFYRHNLMVQAPGSAFITEAFSGVNYIQASSMSGNGGWFGAYVFSMNVVDEAAVPEPGSTALFGVGVLAAFLIRRRQSKQALPKAKA